VVVSALLFSQGRLAWVRAAWQSREFHPLISRPVAEELIRVLEYPKFRLDAGEREFLLGEYLPWCEVVHARRATASIPHCRDPGDRMFLELAVAGKADFLVTGDADLLSLRGEFEIPIVTADGFKAQATSHPPGVAERSPTRRSTSRRKRTR
jgi:putative PIN family toxin of toxin-antitoxin system